MPSVSSGEDIQPRRRTANCASVGTRTAQRAYNRPSVHDCVLPCASPSSRLCRDIDLANAGALGDQQAALFGQACFTPDEAKCTLRHWRVPAPEHGWLADPTAPPDSLPQWPTSLRASHRRTREGSIAVAGSLVQWLRDNLRLITTASDMDSLAGSVPDSGGAVIVPSARPCATPATSGGARRSPARSTGRRGCPHGQYARPAATGTVPRVSGHVFISYSHEDASAYVERLGAFLGEQGIPAWYDREIITGHRWSSVIKERIRSCSVFIVVMTPAAEQSPWVTNEINLARQLGKLIVPLLLDGQEFFGLNHLQYEDVLGGGMPNESALAAIRAQLDVAAPAPAAPPKPPAAPPMPPAAPPMPPAPPPEPPTPRSYAEATGSSGGSRSSRIRLIVGATVLALVVAVGVSVWLVRSGGSGTPTRSARPPPRVRALPRRRRSSPR